MKKGEVTDLIFSCKYLVCAEKKDFLLLIIVKCCFLYNKRPFPELKVEITVL